MGRPKMKEANRKTRTLLIRVTGKERRAIELGAKRQGLSLSEYARTQLAETR